MTGFSFSPLFGTLALTLALCAVVVAVYGIGLTRFIRQWRASRIPGSAVATDATILDWVRRGLIALVLCAAALGPSTTAQTSTQAVNGTDVFFAVDVTGSMGVSDATYGSSVKLTRLQAAQKAVSDLTTLYAGASYAAISFGTGASLDVPLTPDSRAISNWSENLSVEPTSVSSGSSLDAPLDTLIRTLQQTKESHPNNLSVLYLITDGEQTSDSQRRTFSTLRNYVEGGAVIGTGTEKGGTVPLIESSTSVGSSGNADDSGSESDSKGEGADSQQPVIDPSTKKPAISTLDAENLKDIADEVSIDYLHVDATHTAASLEAKISSEYSLMTTDRKRTKLTSAVWHLGIALFALVLWEFGSALAQQRRYLR